MGPVVAEIWASTGAQVFTFAHAGDGNRHPIIAVHPEDPAHLKAVDRAARARLARRRALAAVA